MKKILLTIHLTLSLLSFAQQEITFIDCTSGTLIKDILVFDLQGSYLGDSTEDGLFRLKNNLNKILIKGIGISDTLADVQDTICLNSYYHPLAEITLSETSIDDKELLYSMLTNFLNNLSSPDSNLYYKLDYYISIPDSNWSEHLTAIMILKPEDFKANIDSVKLLNIKYINEGYNIDSSTYDYISNNQNITKFYIDPLRSNKKTSKRLKKQLKDSRIQRHLTNENLNEFYCRHLKKGKRHKPSFDREYSFYKNLNLNNVNSFLNTEEEIQNKLLGIHLVINRYLNQYSYSNTEYKLIDNINEEIIFTNVINGIRVFKKINITKIDPVNTNFYNEGYLQKDLNKMWGEVVWKDFD
jgi:hypothetical protein